MRILFIQYEMRQIIQNKYFSSKILNIFIPANIQNRVPSVFTRRNDHEFRFYGKNYDIISEQKNDKGVNFVCIHDNKEDELTEEFMEFLKEKKDIQSKIANTLTSVSEVYFEYKQQKTLVSISDIKTFYFYINNYLSIKPETDSPPPKFYS
jgi:hypothetical protein